MRWSLATSWSATCTISDGPVQTRGRRRPGRGRYERHRGPPPASAPDAGQAQGLKPPAACRGRGAGGAALGEGPGRPQSQG